MTLCAAAIAETESCIATISDTMIAGSTISSDGCAVKMEPFARDWVAMFSGDDITPCLPIIKRAEGYLKGRANTLSNVRTIFKRAFQQHLIEMKTDQVLSGYGLDMKTFEKSGRKRFTAEIFNSLCYRMNEIKTTCEFLIYGFDSSGRAHIFTVSDPGTDSVFDKPGFACIGSGRYAADTMLHYFGQSVSSSLPQTVFNLSAAKFMAERSPGVGKETFLYFKRPGSVASRWIGGLLEGLRDNWEKDGRPKMSAAALDFISTMGIRTLP
jgi:hypothetical protein